MQDRATVGPRAAPRIGAPDRLSAMGQIIHVASKDVAPLEIYPGVRERVVRRRILGRGHPTKLPVRAEERKDARRRITGVHAAGAR